MKTVANPQEIAARHRKNAQLYYALAGAALVVPVAIWIVLDWLVPLWFAVACLVACRLLYCEASEREKAARNAEQGQRGEDELSEELANLPSGWTVKRNVILGNTGDIDFFVQSPSGKSFAIDAKSHAGEIVAIGQAIYRSYKGAYVPVEKDLVYQAMRQAIAAKETFNLPYVTAVIVFTRAKVLIDPPKIRQAHILPMWRLVDFLIEEETGVFKVPAA